MYCEEIFLEELGLTEHSKSVSAPSVQDSVKEGPPLSREDAAKYRGIAARANYISKDRVDLGFAIKKRHLLYNHQNI